MRVLDVSPQVVTPRTGGSSVRTGELLRALSADHEVRQLSLGRWRPEDATLQYRVTPTYLEQAYRNRVATFLSEVAQRAWVHAPLLAGPALMLRPPRRLAEWVAWADVTLVEFPWLYPRVRRLSPRRPVVLASHNVEVEKFASWAESLTRPRLRRAWLAQVARLERRAVTGADLVVAVSEGDRQGFIRRYGADPGRIVVVANGADTERYRPVDPATRAAARRALGLPDRPTVVFAASGAPPNQAALAWLRRLAGRTARFTFLVVGRVASRGAEGPLVAAGPVDDVQPYYQAADLGICPVQFGGGTKIKLLEALAAGLPTVAFAESLAGLAVQPGREILVAETTEEALLAGLTRLVDDPVLAARIGGAGAAFVRAHHAWADLGRALGRRLAALVEARARG